MDDTTSEEDCFTDSSDGRLTGRKLFASEPIAGSRTTGAPTAVQDRVLLQLEQLADASDWRGVAALEREGEEVAAAVRTAMPGHAAYVYSTLGSAYHLLGDFSKAIKYHTQHLAMAKEMADRAGEGRAHRNLGIAYQSQGDFSRAIDTQKQESKIAKEVSHRAGEGVAGSSPAASSWPVMGDSPVASSLLPASEFSARPAPSHELQADCSIRSARSGRCRTMSAGKCIRAARATGPRLDPVRGLLLTIRDSCTADATESSDMDDTTSEEDCFTDSSCGWEVSTVSCLRPEERLQVRSKSRSLKCMSADDVTSSDTDSSVCCCDLQQTIEKQRWSKFFELAESGDLSYASAAVIETKPGHPTTLDAQP